MNKGQLQKALRDGLRPRSACCNSERVWAEKQKRYWDSEALQYDEFYRNDWYIFEDRILERVIAKLGGSERCLSILDLGCGTGHAIDILNRVFRNYDYTGIDVSPRMINEAIKKFDRGKYIVASFDELEWGAIGTFDFVTGFYGSLSYSWDCKKLILNIKKKLNENGTVILSFYSNISLYRIVNHSASTVDSVTTRGSAATVGCPVKYLSRSSIMGIFQETGYKDIEIYGLSVFGGLYQDPKLWWLDRILCKIFPFLGYIQIVVARS